jgi:hypothetical protein
MDKLRIGDLLRLAAENRLDPNTEIFCENYVGGTQDSFWANEAKVEEYKGTKIINIGGGM